ncbi:MAG: hypothetical protein E6686_03910 [Lachnospiraceae bacterium]|nr:hypothetical protein [Lachnospiraceae bacterium]
MIKIIRQNEVNDKDIICSSCGKQRGVYKISAEDSKKNCCSMDLCGECLSELKNKIKEL